MRHGFVPWAALLAATPVAAQPPAVASPPGSTPVPVAVLPPVDPAALAAARRLLAVVDIRGQMRAVMPPAIEGAMAQVRGTFKAGAVPDGLAARLQEVLAKRMAAVGDVFSPALMEQMAHVYAHHLSTADLNHVADMMGDPAMVRFREQASALTREMMPSIMAAMAPWQASLRKEVQQVVADWVRDHPADRSRLAMPIAS